MSRIYKIHTSHAFPLVEMVNSMTELQMFRPMCGRFYHPTYYFYNFSSFRGVDVTAEDGFIEVRTTILSNHHDHEMSGFMIRHLQELTGGPLTDEADNEIAPYFYDGNIQEWIEEDLRLVHVLLNEEREVNLFGPFGEYHLNDTEVLSVLESSESSYSKMYRLEKMVKQPYLEYFEGIRNG
jgi:hypothetical protein